VRVATFLFCVAIGACSSSEEQAAWLTGSKQFICSGHFDRIHSERGKEVLKTSGQSRFIVARDPAGQVFVDGKAFAAPASVGAHCSTEQVESFELSRCHSESVELLQDHSLILTTNDQTEIIRGVERLPETQIRITHVLKCRESAEKHA
jgi:hypothetical protein